MPLIDGKSFAKSKNDIPLLSELFDIKPTKLD